MNDIAGEFAGDLRLELYDGVIARVEQALGVRLDRATLLRKRRTIGACSDRGVLRPGRSSGSSRWAGEVWRRGVLTGVAKPDWYQSVSWADPNQAVWWRADETELISAAPVKPGGTISVDPGLPEGWWVSLRDSLAALAGQVTTRVAKLHSSWASQDYLSFMVDKATGDAGVVVDSAVREWVPAHADLTWANLTAPECWVLDWEDWGVAPRGLDAATLLLALLAVPPLAERIRREFAADLGSRSGQLVALVLCAELASYPDYAGVLLEPARREAGRLLDALTR